MAIIPNLEKTHRLGIVIPTVLLAIGHPRAAGTST
jgi:hypothetical protein